MIPNIETIRKEHERKYNITRQISGLESNITALQRKNEEIMLEKLVIERASCHLFGILLEHMYQLVTTKDDTKYPYYSSLPIDFSSISKFDELVNSTIEMIESKDMIKVAHRVFVSKARSRAQERSRSKRMNDIISKYFYQTDDLVLLNQAIRIFFMNYLLKQLEEQGIGYNEYCSFGIIAPRGLYEKQEASFVQKIEVKL